MISLPILPKPLIPIGDIPIVERIIKRFEETLFSDEEVVIDENTKQMNVYSKKTDKLLCAREYCSLEDVSEKYYIFEFPEKDEWTKPIPRAKIVLETPEEVQAVLSAFAKLREEQNAGNLQ